MEQLIEGAYGLQNVRLTRFERGVVNQNYRLDADEGTHVWKAYATQWYSPEEIGRTCEVQERLRREGVPVPKIVKNRHGAYLTQAGGDFYVLSEYVEGRHYDRPHIPAKAAHAMGRALGQVLTALEKLEPPAAFSMPPHEETVARLRELLRLAEARRQESPLDEAACVMLERKIDALERLAGYHSGFSSLKTQWSHGDYQETNVLFDAQDQVAAVLDFDNLKKRPRGLEMMRAMALGFRANGELMPEAFDFFAGYAEETDVTEEEVALYPGLWAYYSATRYWPLEVRYEEPHAFDPRWERFITSEKKRSWDTYIDLLTDRFVQIVREKKSTPLR